MEAPFVHLRNHSEYSLSDGLLGVSALVEHAAQSGVPAVALTDRCNFYALVKFQKAAFAAGIKPVFGAEIAWS
ncbi:MAG: PHP domain-containing protein, partial [Pseudomonadales bacterium]|nr:PHP domain-containing protein [Pseudomonadales bacterium]